MLNIYFHKTSNTSAKDLTDISFEIGRNNRINFNKPIEKTFLFFEKSHPIDIYYEINKEIDFNTSFKDFIKKFNFSKKQNKKLEEIFIKELNIHALNIFSILSKRNDFNINIFINHIKKHKYKYPPSQENFRNLSFLFKELNFRRACRLSFSFNPQSLFDLGFFYYEINSIKNIINNNFLNKLNLNNLKDSELLLKLKEHYFVFDDVLRKNKKNILYNKQKELSEKISHIKNITVPITQEDFIAVGESFNNCLKDEFTLGKFALDETVIFIYKKKDTSFCVQMNPDFTIKEIKQKYNEPVNSHDFIDMVQFLNKLKTN